MGFCLLRTRVKKEKLNNVLLLRFSSPTFHYEYRFVASYTRIIERFKGNGTHSLVMNRRWAVSSTIVTQQKEKAPIDQSQKNVSFLLLRH
jgi:hypothetical protein